MISYLDKYLHFLDRFEKLDNLFWSNVQQMTKILFESIARSGLEGTFLLYKKHSSMNFITPFQHIMHTENIFCALENDVVYSPRTLNCK